MSDDRSREAQRRDVHEHFAVGESQVDLCLAALKEQGYGFANVIRNAQVPGEGVSGTEGEDAEAYGRPDQYFSGSRLSAVPPTDEYGFNPIVLPSLQVALKALGGSGQHGAVDLHAAISDCDFGSFEDGRSSS
ncbi:MAG: hypothetical protein HONBIEJF_00396 [Fimbriimonadaceae bacterium]|nr:hypothetical protein [Fimbriimonadaceae bacterium]